MKYDCTRCGLPCLSEFAYSKAIERGKEPLCADCQQQKPLYRIQYDDDYCVPHQGFFDADDWPLNDDGLRVFADRATCGHSDCVKPTHHAEPAQVKYKQPKHPRRKGFVKPGPKKRGRPPKLVVKEIKTFAKKDKQVWDYAVIMMLAEAQGLNRKEKVSRQNVLEG